MAWRIQKCQHQTLGLLDLHASYNVCDWHICGASCENRSWDMWGQCSSRSACVFYTRSPTRDLKCPLKRQWDHKFTEKRTVYLSCQTARMRRRYMSAYVRRPLFSCRGNRPSSLSHKNGKGDNSNLLDYNRDCMATVGLKIRLEAMENRRTQQSWLKL